METAVFEKYLNDRMDDLTPSRVAEAMRYSLTAGGKRIRPRLMEAVVHGYGAEETGLYDAMTALECVHTYSLIHDDLPAMDNDDLRRGRPTCHKQFDEATAILAGDGLLTHAFSLLTGKNVPADRRAALVACLAENAGPEGMVLGQDLDIQAENGNPDWEYLKRLQEKKTGCLLACGMQMGAILAGREEDLPIWKEIGMALGLAFQLQDDILDVRLTPEEFGKSNSDERNHKVTGVSLLGEEKAEAYMNDCYDSAEKRINEVKGFESGELCRLVDSLRTRRK
ncbi:MAG: polyprenyl synthetase family protein [Solobacterium sp.]|nr:polyprenyl synthetase family protein [Solobacterium sp.]